MSTSRFVLIRRAFPFLEHRITLFLISLILLYLLYREILTDRNNAASY